MGRTLHGNGTNVCGGMYEWSRFGMPSYWLANGTTQGTRFLRLVRKGTAFFAYGSMAPLGSRGVGHLTPAPRRVLEEPSISPAEQRPGKPSR